MHLPVLSATTIGVGSTTEFIAWVGEERETLRRDLVRDGSLLVRGLPVLDGPESFGLIARTFAPSLRNYVEGQSRRDELAPQVYNSTHHPADQPITLHHELSYAPEPPRWLFFGCKVAATSGGATPLLDGRRFLATLPTRIRGAFEGRGILYVKTMPGTRGMGKSWEQHYETEDKATVEEYLRRTETAFEWTDRGALRIQRVTPAIATHPDTGELVWFNQANLWHITNLGDLGRALQGMLGERNLPTHAFWENGDAIPDDLINEVRQLMWDEASTFSWHPGDVLFIDNRSVAHGRQPYVGDRLLYVAMA